MKRKLSAQTMANFLLILFFILFISFYKYKSTLAGGLIFSFASAGLIGGIADWFSIKSFFKKPLGISWPDLLFKTEMIPKNREKVIAVIVEMIQKKVINKEELKQKISELKISESILEYAISHKLLNGVADEIVGKITDSSIDRNQENFRRLARKVLNQNRKQIMKGVDCLVNWGISSGAIDKFLLKASTEAQKLLRFPGVRSTLETAVANIIKRFSGNNLLKKVLSSLFTAFNDIPNVILKEADERLETLKEPNFIKEYKLSEAIQKNAKYLAMTNLRRFVNTADFMEIFAEVAAAGEAKTPKSIISKMVDNRIDDLNHRLAVDLATREKLISILDEQISSLVYDNIEPLIQNKLNEYTNEMLTEEIYSSVGEDLNMVRLNGSLVGGFVGIVTFLIMYIAG